MVSSVGIELPEVVFSRVSFSCSNFFLFPAKLSMFSRSVPMGGGLTRIFGGPGVICHLIARSEFRKMCPFSRVTVCSGESTIASFTGLKYGSPFFRLIFFQRLPLVVSFTCEGRLRWAAEIGVVRFPEETLARGRLVSESEKRSMSASCYPSSAPSWSSQFLARWSDKIKILLI